MHWTGFNFQWMFSWAPQREPEPPDLKALDFMAKHGFNFARVAADYRFWTESANYYVVDPRIFAVLDSYLEACRQRDIHLSFNMHRVPGYCINQPEIEKHNLWTDKEAQDGFAFQWSTFATYFEGVPPEHLSFDLVNEPPNIGQYGMTREIHEKIIRNVVESIRRTDDTRVIVIDGLEGGNTAMPELADLDVTHSGRGYQPMTVSHKGADWWSGWNGQQAEYPGEDGEGRTWNRDSLAELYKPWKEVEARGRPVHIGEFGCYNKTDNELALRWLGDLTSVWRENGWGWAAWNFKGPFGIVEHGRPNARLERMDGFMVDRDLLELLKP